MRWMVLIPRRWQWNTPTSIPMKSAFACRLWDNSRGSGLKHPEGRVAVTVTPAKECFIATARIYANYTNPSDQYLAEATASRGYLPDKPTVSPREWAQTAAIGRALQYAGFGLQFAAAGDAFDMPAVDELSGIVWSGEESPQDLPELGGASANMHMTMPMPTPAAQTPGRSIGESNEYTLSYQQIQRQDAWGCTEGGSKSPRVGSE